MHIVITDSGLGGLSVCAKLIQQLKCNVQTVNLKNSSSELKITYINAAPSNKIGYNSMSEEIEKISTFKNFILNTEKFFSPNFIFVACGTLSVLLKKLNLSSDITKKIKGIVPIAVNLLLENLNQNPKTKVIIFGTPTTIFENTFQKKLFENGIAKNRIISQSCPELATLISNDLEGRKASKTIHKYVKEALKKIHFNIESPLIVFLGCTHYAYRENYFYKSFSLEGYNNINILNPNFASAETLRNIVFNQKNYFKSKVKNISLNFVSPYAIPNQEEITLTKLINHISIDTALALKNAIICPQLIEN